ncbi:nucleotide sugar dehydrogenase [Shimia sp. MMG029]|uniref:nucleotide sugar dehydrogenase n=1 Tax=Shimia sp. MMG029 TaxID=3021978 RepID=UPI0022FE013F|nr:nucleotide sugar dehydrogenase [Shimia sp. MMG029]MDA5556955.1 nucleotide sugar dehydrogenase [Shimia sp. MMG029]
MKIVVVGLGYVGCANAALLAQHNDVIGVDLSESRVADLNKRKSPVDDASLSEFLETEKLSLSASTDLVGALPEADFVIVATPTNYDIGTNSFDTGSVELVLKTVADHEPNACIVIKSTIPVGFVEDVRRRYPGVKVFFSPEFLREGKALYDNLHPSRIIVGDGSSYAREFSKLLQQGAQKKDIDVLFTGPNECEAIKLFSNMFLATRVAFFNELDSYALGKGMDAAQIIQGVSLDPRIGMHYNNPSFGYGGYCLPKDSKQLLASYNSIPQDLIAATVASNETRKDYLARCIMERNPQTVGVFRLIMKTDSDNFRETSVKGLMERCRALGSEVVVYEPNLRDDSFEGYPVVSDLSEFLSLSDVILANRTAPELTAVSDKVFTRDIFGSN